MRFGAASLLIATALAPAAAVAQSSQPAARTIPVVAHAPQVCAVQAPQIAGGRQVNFRGLNGSTLQIDRLVDPTTLSTNAASTEIRFEAVCNYPHRLTLETQNNGLFQTIEHTSRPAEGFGHAIPYRATLSWGLENLRLDADAKVRRISDRTIFIDRATSGDMLLRLEIDPGATNDRANAPLIAGYYGDTLRVTVEPQQ